MDMECTVCFNLLSDEADSQSPTATQPPNKRARRSSQTRPSAKSSASGGPAGASSQPEICITKCGHIFHKVCVLSWLENNKTCPFCTKNLNAKQLGPVFFPTLAENKVCSNCARSQKEKMDIEKQYAQEMDEKKKLEKQCAKEMDEKKKLAKEKKMLEKLLEEERTNAQENSVNVKMLEKRIQELEPKGKVGSKTRGGQKQTTERVESMAKEAQLFQKQHCLLIKENQKMAKANQTLQTKVDRLGGDVKTLKEKLKKAEESVKKAQKRRIATRQDDRGRRLSQRTIVLSSDED